MARIPDAHLPDEVPEPMRNNLSRTLFNNPGMFQGFWGLAGSLYATSTLSHRARELVVLRISAQLGADVQWAPHVAMAQAAGVSLEEVKALHDGSLAGLPPEEQAAVVFAEAVEAGTVDDDVWAGAALHFTPDQLLELTMLAAFYSFASRVSLALGIEVDEGLPTIAGLDDL